MLSYISNWSALGALRVTETAASNHRVRATIPLITVLKIHASCLMFIPVRLSPKSITLTCPKPVRGPAWKLVAFARA